MRKLLFLLLFASCAFCQESNQQPFEFKGVKLGVSLSDWKQAGIKCLDLPVPAKQDEFTCVVAGGTYAGVHGRLLYSFYKERLASVYFSFSHDNYDTLKEALQGKFGKPTSSEIKTYQNGYGATFKGESLTWMNSLSSIALSEIEGQRDVSVLLFAHTEISAEQIKANKAPKKDDM